VRNPSSSTEVETTDVGGAHTRTTRLGHLARAVLAGVIVAAVAAFWSWNPSLWSDEAATISAARRSIGDLWRMTGSIDAVHGLYYLLMHGWIALFGEGAFLLRLPSALAMGVAGTCVYLLGARLGGTRIALCGAAMFAILPRVFWAGAEARPFALTAVLAVAATLVLVVALDSETKGRIAAWIGYSALLLMGIVSNVYVGLLIVAHLVTLLWDRRVTRSQRLSWLISAGSAVVLSLPFVLEARTQVSQLGERTFGVLDLGQNVVVNQWFLGDTPTTTTGVSRGGIVLSDPGSWWLPAALVFAALSWVLIILGVVRELRAQRSALDLEMDDPDDFYDEVQPRRRSLTAWLLPWAVIPTVIIGLYSILITPMYSPRYLTFAAPAVALLLAAGLLALPWPKWRIAVAAVLVVAAVPIYISQRELNGKNGSDWVSVASFIQTNARPGDGVYFTPRYDVPGETVEQTTRGIRTAYPNAFRGLFDVTLMTTAAEAGNLAGISRRLANSTDEFRRLPTLWVIHRFDYPATSLASDAALLTSLGFRETLTWSGPLDVVVRYDRQ
jgi:mannosyltransferase